MRSAHTPLVSVVTPAYNEEAHIRQCIESVLAQTYTHWDYTIVNNRSTDRTFEIAQEYAAKDHRIRIHNNETFVPAIANYNNAFRQISPECKYCKVVGADDWLYPECLEKMVHLAEEHPTAAIIGAYQITGARLSRGGYRSPSPSCQAARRAASISLETIFLLGRPLRSCFERTSYVAATRSTANPTSMPILRRVSRLCRIMILALCTRSSRSTGCGRIH